MKRKNILIVGVGGQGTLLASKVLGGVAVKESLDVKISEVHGMSQRGGSVVTHVKIGEKVFSPTVDKKGTDYLVAFEKMEAFRWKEYLKNNGTVIINDEKINPMSVVTGKEKYPQGIIKNFKKSFNTISFNACDIAEKSGSHKTVNMVLLGVLASELEFKKVVWIQTIKETVKSSLIEQNLRAFNYGYEVGIGNKSEQANSEF